MKIRILNLLETDQNFECLNCHEVFPNEDCVAVVEHDEALCMKCADRVVAEAEDRMDGYYER